MKIKARPTTSAVIIDLDHRLTVEEDFTVLEALLESLIQGGQRRFVLNCERTQALDSTGIGELVRCFNRVRAAGGRLCLLNVARRQRELLELCCLQAILPILSSEAEAVDSLLGEKAARGA